ncbi:3-keto-5-aminohexanoate cleavage protein [Chloroflexota bacterium]
MSELSGVWDYQDPNEWLHKAARNDLPPLIITAAITGGIQGKEINPNHPETPEEQAGQAYECYKLGASIVHIHARHPDNPTQDSTDPARYRMINAMIREKCPDIIINNTTSNRAMDTSDTKSASIEERLRTLLESNPEMCSLNMGPLIGRLKLRARPPYRPEELTIDVQTAVDFAGIELIAKAAAERGIKPEIEVWHTGQLPIIRQFIKSGLLIPPYWLQIIFGHPNGTEAMPKNLINMMEIAPKNSIASVIALMPYQTQLLTMAIILGLHVRTGMEDNPYYEKGVLCTGNAQLVERIVRIARELGREIATPKQARKMMGIPEKPSQY